MTLYLYPEEWTGRRAREVHTLSTCVALVRAGRPVTLVTAGGEPALRAQLQDVAGASAVDGLELVFISRKFGPIRSAGIFRHHFQRWLGNRSDVDGAFAIHLKAAQLLRESGIPYVFEAHEIFAETRRGSASAQRTLENAEHTALTGAQARIATSPALADALSLRYALPNDFHIVPNAGMLPLLESTARAEGSFVYLGSIADWKGLELIIAATQAAQFPLRVIGGTEVEWSAVAKRLDVRHVTWRPRVPVAAIADELAGARAGLVATLPESGSGRYSCPMKLFDYARCGLPVLATDLPALKSLGAGAWLTTVAEPTKASWTSSLRAFHFDASAARRALDWAAEHTWSERGETLNQILNYYTGSRGS